MTAKGWALLGIGLVALGCERPAKERAERDLEVGHASSSELDVDVVHGLAAVRALDAERVVLWASAPSFELELSLVTEGADERPGAGRAAEPSQAGERRRGPDAFTSEDADLFGGVIEDLP